MLKIHSRDTHKLKREIRPARVSKSTSQIIDKIETGRERVSLSQQKRDGHRLATSPILYCKNKKKSDLSSARHKRRRSS
jgi:hypothetical protein